MTTESSSAPIVTAHNYVRAETDFQMKSYIEKYGAFG